MIKNKKQPILNVDKLICPKCKKITTNKEILEEIEFSGQGMCLCQFSKHFINDKGEDDVWFPRILNEYKPYIEYKIKVLEEKAKQLYIKHSNWDKIINLLSKKELEELKQLYKEENKQKKDRDYPF